MKDDRVSEARPPYGIFRARASTSVVPWTRKKYWTEEEYLALETNRLIEFNNGELEILPMPDYLHQSMSFYLARLFLAYSEKFKPGFVVQAPFRMKTTNGKYREPDVIFLFDEHADKFDNKYWTGADIAVEIVSPGGETRDKIDKRKDYAATGIAEYWIIEPQEKSVTVLKLFGAEYIEHGVFTAGQNVTSALLNGFSVSVDTLVAQRVPKIRR